jgi:hypothetical protein
MAENIKRIVKPPPPSFSTVLKELLKISPEDALQIVTLNLPLNPGGH